MFFKKHFILIVITLLLIFFRLYGLGSVPPHPSLDEVSIGYNAFSILKTGVDEYGEKFPILLRAYDDWRPALYVYLVIPFIKILNLNVVAVRLPSVILSIIVGITIYFLTKEIFPKAKRFNVGGVEFSIAEIVFFLYAISPWNIYLSRLGHEVNAAFSFLLFGVYFFVRFVSRQEKWSLILSSVFLALSFDTYQSTKIVVPLVVLVLFGLFYKKLFRDLMTLIISAIIGILIILPILVASTSPEALVRFEATNIINSQSQEFEESAKRLIAHREEGNIIGAILDNRRVVAARIVGNAYASHFNIFWLISNSGGEPFKIPGFGILYLFEPILFLIGFIFALKKKIIDRNIFIFLNLWILISIIPASITTGYPHAMRTYTALIPLLIIEGIGLYFILERFKKTIIPLVSVLAIIIFFIIFSYQYFSFFPFKLSNQFQYGVIQAFDYAKNIEGDFEKVIVSNNDNLYQSYMFYLYANKIDPQNYQKNGGTISGGYDEEHSIGKYEFVNFPNSVEGENLYILNPSEVNSDFIVIKDILFLDGNSSISIAKKKN